MSPILTSFGLGMFGSLILYLVFQLLKSDWPNNYSDMKNVVDSASQRNVWIYVLMRFVPMYIVSVLVASLTESANGQIWIALLTCAVLHVVFTNFRPHVIRRTFIPSRVRPRYITLFFWTLGSVTIATVSAASTWRFLTPVLPNFEDLVQAIWTSLFVGLVVILFRSFGTFEYDLEKQIGRAKRDLGHDLQDVIQAAARRNDVSPDFIQAVVLTECIQRPKWIRKIEYIKGHLFSSKGSYGVAQANSSKPISDAESIYLLCQNHQGYYPETRDSIGYNQTLLTVQLETINPAPIFVEQALEIFQYLAPPPREQSEKTAHDGRKFIELHSINREGMNWILRVSLGPGWRKLDTTVVTRDLVEESSEIDFDTDSTLRRTVNVEFPVDVRWIQLDTSEPTSYNVDSDSLVIDLEDPYVK